MEQIKDSIRRMQQRAERLTKLKLKTTQEIDSVIAEIHTDIKALEIQLESLHYTDSQSR